MRSVHVHSSIQKAKCLGVSVLGSLVCRCFKSTPNSPLKSLKPLTSLGTLTSPCYSCVVFGALSPKPKAYKLQSQQGPEFDLIRWNGALAKATSSGLWGFRAQCHTSRLVPWEVLRFWALIPQILPRSLARSSCRLLCDAQKSRMLRRFAASAKQPKAETSCGGGLRSILTLPD